MEAFLNCDGVTKLLLPKNNEQERSSSNLILYTSSFQDCYNILQVDFGNRVQQIGESCFKNCYNIQSCAIPESVVMINISAFYNCSSITSFTFTEGNGLTEIPSYMCYNCTSLSYFEFPLNITVINSFAFVNTAITSIELPTEVELIRRSSFQNCVSLTNFSIPENSQLKEFESNVFSGCTSFKEISNECDNFKLWNSALFDREMKELIILPPACGVKYFGFPETITKIRTSSLESVYSLEVVFISASVNSIQDYAFRHCTNLRYITIPKNVVEIGENVFEGCNRLQCGISIENNEPDYIDKLVNTAKLPQNCLMECIRVCTNPITKIMPLRLFVIFLSLSK